MTAHALSPLRQAGDISSTRLAQADGNNSQRCMVWRFKTARSRSGKRRYRRDLTPARFANPGSRITAVVKCARGVSAALIGITSKADRNDTSTRNQSTQEDRTQRASYTATEAPASRCCRAHGSPVIQNQVLAGGTRSIAETVRSAGINNAGEAQADNWPAGKLVAARTTIANQD